MKCGETSQKLRGFFGRAPLGVAPAPQAVGRQVLAPRLRDQRTSQIRTVLVFGYL